MERLALIAVAGCAICAGSLTFAASTPDTSRGGGSGAPGMVGFTRESANEFRTEPTPAASPSPAAAKKAAVRKHRPAPPRPHPAAPGEGPAPAAEKGRSGWRQKLHNWWDEHFHRLHSHHHRAPRG